MVKNLLLLLFSICFILLFSEIGIRYQVQAWPFEMEMYVPEYLTPRDIKLRWRFSPSDGRNSLGLRNREVGQKKPEIFRILFLGDSLIWSGETSTDELYTEVLEHRLNSRFHTNPPSFEIINAGIPGYTTYQELEFLKIYGLQMKPDFVVLGFVFNDLYYKFLHKPTDQKLIDSEPDTRLYRFNPSGFPGALFGRSYLAHMIVDRSEVIWRRILRRPSFPFEQRRDFFLAWKSYGWNHTRNLLGEMQTLLKERGISFFIVVFPVSDQVNEQYRKLDEVYVLYPQSRVREICEELGIPSLDLTESLYQKGGKTLFRDYLHLNADGNDIVADELEKFLVDKLEQIPH